MAKCRELNDAANKQLELSSILETSESGCLDLKKQLEFVREEARSLQERLEEAQSCVYGGEQALNECQEVMCELQREVKSLRRLDAKQEKQVTSLLAYLSTD